MDEFEAVKLNSKIAEQLTAMGIQKLTEIQRMTFPSAANGHDIIGVSQTGSGKTLAFLLPLVQQILLSDKPFHALILVPTRELAAQISAALDNFGRLSIRSSLLLGGDDFNDQAKSLSKKPHIVIGTPGRITKHIQKTKNFHIERIRKLIFDEADRFFEQDFATDLEIIAKKLKMKNQTLMFTATLTERCRRLANLFMRTPKIYTLTETAQKIVTLAEGFILVPESYKLTLLYNYLAEHKDTPSIVFFALCSTCQKIGTTLARLGISCEYLHGKMPQARRIEAVSRFRDGGFTVLLATDVAGRGLDIPHVGLVVNYDLPVNSDIYTHRIGRTARAGREGSTVSLVTQYDVEKLQRIEYSLKRKIDVVEYKTYTDHQRVSDVYEEVAVEFNQDRSFTR